jgi:hypothetical protein
MASEPSIGLYNIESLTMVLMLEHSLLSWLQTSKTFQLDLKPWPSFHFLLFTIVDFLEYST